MKSLTVTENGSGKTEVYYFRPDGGISSIYGIAEGDTSKVASYVYKGDKIPSDKKGTIEAALGSLKEAVKSQNASDIDRYTEQLNNAWHAASEDMAKAAQGGQQAGPQGPQPGPQNQGPDDQGPDEQ